MGEVDQAKKDVKAPRPKSPPKYPDLCGRRRLQLEVQILNREIGFLEEELQALDVVQPVSKCCKEVNEFVAAKQDPLIPITKKKHKSCCLCWWMRSKLCFCFPWFCCSSRCLPEFKGLSCFDPCCCEISCCKPSCSCIKVSSCCEFHYNCYNPSCVICCSSRPHCGGKLHCSTSCGPCNCRTNCCSCSPCSDCKPSCRCSSESCCSCTKCSCCQHECCNCKSSCFMGRPSFFKAICSRSCCTVPKPSCPDCSCGCILPCKRCTEGYGCPQCSDPCSSSGCLR